MIGTAAGADVALRSDRVVEAVLREDAGDTCSLPVRLKLRPEIRERLENLYLVVTFDET